MDKLEKKLSNGVVLLGIRRDMDDGSKKIGWYGAEFDTKGGTFRGVYSVDSYDAEDNCTVGALTRFPHGYTTEDPAESDAKDAVIKLLAA